MISLSKRIIKAKDVKITTPGDEGDSNRTRGGLKTNRKSVIANVPGTQADGEKQKDHESAIYNRGFTEGLEAGIGRAQQEMTSALGAVLTLIEELKTLKQNLWADSERDMLDLAFATAEKIIQKEVSIDRDIVLAVLKDAAGYIQDKEEMKISLNPADYEYVVTVQPDMLSGRSDIGNVVIEKDGQIERGGALIETRFAGVDARISEQLNKIRQSLIS